jgi:hypothetical protein
MCGAIPLLSHYAFMAWCSVEAQGQLYLFTFYKNLSMDMVKNCKHGDGMNIDDVFKRIKYRKYIVNEVYQKAGLLF